MDDTATGILGDLPDFINEEDVVDAAKDARKTNKSRKKTCGIFSDVYCNQLAHKIRYLLFI